MALKMGGREEEGGRHILGGGGGIGGWKGRGNTEEGRLVSLRKNSIYSMYSNYTKEVISGNGGKL